MCVCVCHSDAMKRGKASAELVEAPNVWEKPTQWPLSTWRILRDLTSSRQHLVASWKLSLCVPCRRDLGIERLVAGSRSRLGCCQAWGPEMVLCQNGDV